MILFLILFMVIIHKACKKHSNAKLDTLGDIVGLFMVSFILMSLSMWPLLALMHGGFTFPQQATTTMRVIAASITCAVWYVLLWHRPIVYIRERFFKKDTK